MELKGDLLVKNVVSSRRTNEEMNTETITGAKTLVKNSARYQNLSAASGQDVIMPDATTIPLGWTVYILSAGAATLTVKKSGGSATIHTILTGKAYEFTLTGNSDAAGTWNVDFKNPMDSIPAPKATPTFDATTSWGTASGGYYSQTFTAASHGIGTTPIYQVEELSGSDYIKTLCDEEKVNASGDITIRVTESPDGRFAGRIVIQ